MVYKEALTLRKNLLVAEIKEIDEFLELYDEAEGKGELVLPAKYRVNLLPPDNTKWKVSSKKTDVAEKGKEA